MTTTNPQPTRNLKHEAQNLMAILSMPEGQEKLGSTVALAERLLLKICLGNSETSEWTNDQLQIVVDRVKAKLGVK